jgi:hypothetical protein
MTMQLNARARRLWHQIAALAVFAIVIGAAGPSVAGPVPACAADSLSNYVNASVLPGAVCSVGALDFGGFSYHPTSNAPLASGIEIDPASTGTGLSIRRAGTGTFSAAAGQTISFEIDFTVTVDPASPIFGATLSIPGFSGNASATEFLCSSHSYVFTGGCAGALPQTFAVGNGGIANAATALLPFAGAVSGIENVGLVVTVGGIGSGGAIETVSSGFVQVSPVPELPSWATMLAGLVGAGAVGKRLRSRRT